MAVITKVEIVVDPTQFHEMLEQTPMYEWFDASTLTFTDEGLSLVYFESDGGRDPVTKSATWQEFADGLAQLASGLYTNYDAGLKRLTEYHQLACMGLLFTPTDVDYDMDTVDIILQQVLLGGAINA